MCPTASLIDNEDMVKLCQESPFRFLGIGTIKMVKNIEHFKGAWQIFRMSFCLKFHAKLYISFIWTFQRKEKLEFNFF